MRAYNLAEKKILIYGAGSLGITCKKVLNKSNIDTYAWIDKRYQTLQTYENCRVYGIPELEEIEGKEQYCIIIAIRNVFEHSQLALTFYQLGFNAIIYKPISILRKENNVIATSINRAHDTLMIQFSAPVFPISYYEMEKIYSLEDNGFIKNNNDKDMCTVYIAAEMLFSNRLKNSLWSERNFVSNYVAVDLYKTFFRDEGIDSEIIRKYVDRFALPGALAMNVNVSGEWENILIESRLAVYNEMCNKLAYSPEFFIDNCTTVKRRENGGFYLSASGKNRVSFLISRGQRYIPVNIAKQEYENFINIRMVQEIEKYLNTNAINQMLIPVPHPYFYQCRYAIPQYMEQWGAKVGSILCEACYQKMNLYEYSGINIIDYSNDEGTISRFLSMMGYPVVRTKSDEFIELIDKLLGIRVQGDFLEEYDVTIISNIDGKLEFPTDDERWKTSSICFAIIQENDEKQRKIFEEVYPNGKEILKALWLEKYVKGYVFWR